MGIARRSFLAGRPPLGLDRRGAAPFHPHLRIGLKAAPRSPARGRCDDEGGRGSRDPHSGKKEGDETPEARVLRIPRHMPTQELREPWCLVNA